MTVKLLYRKNLCFWDSQAKSEYIETFNNTINRVVAPSHDFLMRYFHISPEYFSVEDLSRLYDAVYDFCVVNSIWIEFKHEETFDVFYQIPDPDLLYKFKETFYRMLTLLIKEIKYATRMQDKPLTDTIKELRFINAKIYLHDEHVGHIQIRYHAL